MKPHDLRLALLDNGYKPLPLSGKRCFLTGWSEDPIDDKRVQSWRRMHSPNAGIRCDNIAVIDLDITDEDLLDDVFDIVINRLGDTPLERVGMPPKTALVYRLDDKGTKMRTGKFNGHEVEILAGTGCQMAAFGNHPGTGKPYAWWDVSPTEVHRDDLPIVAFDVLIKLRHDLVGFFEDKGLTLDVDGQIGHIDESRHDLTYDMVFETLEHGELTVREIESRLKMVGGGIRTNLTAFRPNSDSAAGLFGVSEQGVHLTDFRTGITHYLEADTAIPEMFAAVLPKRPAASPPPTESSTLRLEAMIDSWVHVLADNTVRHVDRPNKPVKMTAFENQHKFKIGNAWAVTKWLQHAELKKAGGTALLPGTGPGVHISIDGDTVLNTYSPPIHNTAGGDVLAWDAFISHLFPLDGEAELFLDWLACKVQNRDLRMHALLLVALQFGTGRGTLFGILKKLFGASYVTPNVDLDHFLGLSKSTQGQYNEYMTNSLLVCVSEARTSGAPSWKDGAEAYENLKQRIDTQASDLFIRRKTVGNSSEMTYASVIIATQHQDALPLPENDRRMLVLTNGSPLSYDDAEIINDWADNPANITALFNALLKREIHYKPHGRPPETRGRSIMIREAKSALDQLAEIYVKEAVGSVCYLAQFKDFCSQNAASVEGNLPSGNYDKVAAGALIKFGAQRGEKIKINAKLGSRIIWFLQPSKVDLRIANMRKPVDAKTKNAFYRKEIAKNDAKNGLNVLSGLPRAT